MTRGIHTDCLLNYETVKYFGGEEYEATRYHDAICEYQALEAKVTGRLFLLISAFVFSDIRFSFPQPSQLGSELHHSAYLDAHTLFVTLMVDNRVPVFSLDLSSSHVVLSAAN